MNVIEGDCGAPFTVTLPLEGEDVYPATEPTVKAYVPFFSENMIVVPVDDIVLPFSVTDQEVPVASPLSVNVTEYVPGAEVEKVIDTIWAAPVTVTDPDDGVAVNPETAPTVYE